jgi:hypothetical protein
MPERTVTFGTASGDLALAQKEPGPPLGGGPSFITCLNSNATRHNYCRAAIDASNKALV